MVGICASAIDLRDYASLIKTGFDNSLKADSTCSLGIKIFSLCLNA